MASFGGDGFCGGEFWDLDAFWNTEKPRLTNCFRNSVLVWIPCGFLWITWIIDYCSRRRQENSVPKEKPVPFTPLGVAKWGFSLLLIICTAAELSYMVYIACSTSIKVPFVNFISVSVRLFTFILALLLQMRQKRQGQMNSFTLSIFWFIYFVCNIFTSPVLDLIFDSIDLRSDSAMFVIGTMAFASILVEMILSTFTDPPYSYFWDCLQDEYLIEHQPIISRLMFSWVNRLLCYGYRNTIAVSDLDQMHPKKQTKAVYQTFHKQWLKEEQKSKLWKSPQQSKLHDIPHDENEKTDKDGSFFSGPSLYMALFRALWAPLLITASLEVACDFLSLLPPMILDLIIQFIDNEEPMWHGYVYAVVLFGTTVLYTLISVQLFHYLISASLVPRSGLPASIYRKVLRLSSGARRQYTLGELCNLVSVDVQMVVSLMWSLNMTWSAPLRIILTVALLWQYLGIASLAGVAVMVVIMPLTAYLTKWTHQFQKSQMKWKDSRLRQMNEILNGIKVLKLFAWEYPFLQQVKDIREKEVVTLKKLAFLNAAVVFIWIFAPFMVAISSFVTFVLIDENNVLDPSIAFVSLTLFNNLRTSMSVIPQLIAEIIQCRIAARRITSFLLSEELKQESSESDMSPGNALEIDGGSFSWTNGEAPFLRDVTFSVAGGSLVAVVGQVGSGKSALLAAVLGEMYTVQGSMRLKRDNRIAYVAQQAWIQNDTLRQNILFLREMNERRYGDALDRCCLRPDLKVLPGGDLAEIGEKGVNLSGGQKQRVSLARALYQNADFYLFDDPLSAVDSHVGAHIFKHVIGPEGALRKKTRILVTHDYSVLPETDVIYLMDDGKILETGSYRELMDQKGEFAKFVEEHLSKLKNNDLEEENSEPEVPKPESPDGKLSTEELKSQMKRLGSRLSRTISVTDKVPKKINLVEKEKMETGRVKTGVFITYFRNASFSLTTLTILGFAAYQIFEVGSSIWLGVWSTDEPLSDGTQDVATRNLRIGVYGLLGLGQGLSTLIAALVLAVASTRASIKFHRSMLWSVLRSPMEFFDVTPIGRIINRFGKDINTVDINVPSVLNNVMTIVAGAVGIIGVIAFSNPIFILMLVPLGGIYIFYQVFYMATSRQVRRLLSVTLSPVFSFFSESVQGASTIRAFGAQRQFTDREDNLLQDNNRTFFTNTLLNRCVGVRLQLLGAVVVLLAALLSVFQRNVFTAAAVGFTLSYALNITELLMRLVRNITQLETHMVSVERIDEYSQLTSESPWKSGSCRVVSSDWPYRGAVSFRDYKMRYRTGMDLVLRGVTVDIEAGEKVGVVGRTGAGKSSLALALFRMVEPAEGLILIDGVDITLLGLHDLRSKLTVIPQDPVLFSGSLKLNLDPLGQHDDAELWRAVEHAHLKNFVSTLKGGLHYHVAEGGENLSVGQRQQLCLARALLKKTKILVLDEATAAVDMETDRLIQNTIRKEFEQCTVITIAHRLYTILDYDRILVMDNGRIVEQGHPDDLILDTNSIFYELCRAAGLL